TEHLAQALDVSRLVQLHIRVAEVKLDAAAEAPVGGAAGELLQRVVLQRVEAAERDQPVRIARRLRGGPVVLGPYLGVLVFYRASRAPVYVCDREHDRAADARRVEEGDEVVGIEWSHPAGVTQ